MKQEHDDKDRLEAIAALREAETAIFDCTGSAFLSGAGGKPRDRKVIREMLLEAARKVLWVRDEMEHQPTAPLPESGTIIESAPPGKYTVNAAGRLTFDGPGNAPPFITAPAPAAPTPRTDAEIVMLRDPCAPNSLVEFVRAPFARQLERAEAALAPRSATLPRVESASQDVLEALKYLHISTAPDGQWADQAVHGFVGAMLKTAPVSTTGALTLVPVEPAPTYIESSGRWKWPLPERARFPGCCTEVVTASREWWEYAPSEAKPHPMAEAVQLRDGKWYWAVSATQERKT